MTFPAPSSSRYEFQVDSPLSSNSLARVLKASVPQTSQVFAVKQLLLAGTSPESRQRTHLEAELLKTLTGHPNVIRLHEVFESCGCLYLVLDFYERDLLAHLSTFEGGMPEREARVMFKQMLRTLKYLHKKHIVHGDLKLDNFLYDPAQQKVVLIDFGSASKISKKDDPHLRILSGTPSYVAPEVVIDKQYDGYLSDVYSLGVILFGLATNRLPFDDEDSVYYYSWVENYLDSLNCPTTRMLPPVPLSPELLELLEKMLCLNPNFRIPLRKIKKEPWIKSARKDPTKKWKKNAPRLSLRIDTPLKQRRWNFALFNLK